MVIFIDFFAINHFWGILPEIELPVDILNISILIPRISIKETTHIWQVSCSLATEPLVKYEHDLNNVTDTFALPHISVTKKLTDINLASEPTTIGTIYDSLQDACYW